MKWRLALVTALCAALWFGAAHPQSNVIGGGVWGDVKHSSGAAYQGPGDAISGATAFYSCARAYNAAYATALGNMCIIADAATGNTSTCTLVAAATGFVNLTGTYCPGTLTPSAFCTAHTSCVISKMFDQTAGNNCTSATCDILTATLAAMPALTFNALNGLPCATSAGAENLLSATALATVTTQPWTYTAVGTQTSNNANAHFLGSSSGNPVTFFNNANAGEYAGSAVLQVATTNGTYYGLQFIGNGASSVVNANGATATGNPGTTAPGGSGATIELGASSSSLIGVTCEAGLWPIGFTGGNQTTMFNNMNGSSGYNGGL